MKQLEQRLNLTTKQHDQLGALEREFLTLNARFNLVSDSSADAFKQRHLAHSLVIATRTFPTGATVVDWGTGGGLPLLPLAIVFPEVQFVGIDSVGKKVRAVATMARRLGLPNVDTWHGRAETWKGQAHFAVSRATAPLDSLWHWTERVLTPWSQPLPEGAWSQGLITLKGGDLGDEIDALPSSAEVREVTPVSTVLSAPFFREKVLLHVTPA